MGTVVVAGAVAPVGLNGCIVNSFAFGFIFANFERFVGEDAGGGEEVGLAGLNSADVAERRVAANAAAVVDVAFEEEAGVEEEVDGPADWNLPACLPDSSPSVP